MNTPILGTRIAIRHLLPPWLCPLYRALTWLVGGITLLVFCVIALGKIIGGGPFTTEFVWIAYRFAREVGLTLVGRWVFVFAPIIIVYGLWHSNRSRGNQPASDERTEVTDTGIVRRRNENGYIVHPDRHNVHRVNQGQTKPIGERVKSIRNETQTSLGSVWTLLLIPVTWALLWRLYYLLSGINAIQLVQMSLMVIVLCIIAFSIPYAGYRVAGHLGVRNT